MTTLPAPTMLPRPTVNPGRMIAPAPTHASSSTVTGAADSRPAARPSGVCGWSAAISCDPRADERPLTDPHGRAVEDHDVAVQERAVAQRHVPAVVAPQRPDDHRVRADRPQEPAQDLHALRLARGALEALQHRAAARSFGDELGIGGVVRQPGDHALALLPHRA